jgi:hypothetical protein
VAQVQAFAGPVVVLPARLGISQTALTVLMGGETSGGAGPATRGYLRMGTGVVVMPGAPPEPRVAAWRCAWLPATSWL